MRYQICVSGAASGKTVEASHQLAYDLGKAIAKAGKTLTTGATVGLPWFAAKGAVSVKGRAGVSVDFGFDQPDLGFTFGGEGKAEELDFFVNAPDGQCGQQQHQQI
jgi:hypothetical protein